ncbi:MAG: hypothetical protein HY754_00260 [Nitrospirae bacterium]|nr:hypothetical protein [Nitrospirota bacterium]
MCKKILSVIVFSIFLVVFASTTHAGNWNGWIYQNPYPTKNTLLAVKFITPQKGWVVGEHGTILYTEDGGENWEAQESGIEEDLKSVTFVNEKVGWTVGNGGVIIHTEDGGKKWERQGESKTNSSILELLGVKKSKKQRRDNHIVFFLNENEGWVGGDNGTLLSTRDGGRTWHKQEFGRFIDIAGVFFINSNTGWVLAEGKIYRTKDGGKTWESSELPTVRIYTGGYATPIDHRWHGSVYFLNEKKGFAAVGYNSILVTEDGGKTWIAKDVSDSVDRLAFTDEKNGCMAASSILCTNDGGKTWKEKLGVKPGKWETIEGFQVSLWGLSFADQTTGYSVGMDGQIFKTEDRGKTWKIKSRKGDRYSYFLDSQIGWNTQNDYKQRKSRIIKTEDGGRTWKVQKTFDYPVDIRFFFINSSTGWAVGNEWGHDRSGSKLLNSFILNTNDGGQTWESQFQEKSGQKGIFQEKTSITDGLFDIFLRNSTTGWVAGSQGVILHTKDGEHWIMQESGTKLRLRRVQFIDAKRGWIVGSKVTEGNGTAVILYTNDGGEHWQIQWKKKTDWLGLHDLQFTDENNGWAAGQIHEYSDDGIFVQTKNGKTWTEREFKKIYFEKIFFLDKNRGVILTKKGQMLITRDGGKTWAKQRMPIRRYPWHVSEIFLEKKIDK